MANKIYTIGGQEFRLLENNLGLLNKAAPLIARLRKLSFEYTKDIDMSLVNRHEDRITELKEAKSQLEEFLTSGKDEAGGELSDDTKSGLSSKIAGLESKISDALSEFQNDKLAQNLIKLKNEMESYSLVELISDIAFIKPILKKILTGGSIDTIDFTDMSSIGFVRDVITDFFSVMRLTSLR